MTRWALLFGIIGLATPWAGEARAWMCRRRPAVDLLYPNPGQAVPRNVVIYLRPNRSIWERFSAGKIKIIDTLTKRSVALAIVAPTGSGLVRVVPQTPLTGLREYLVRHGKRVLGRFRTLKGSQPARAPKLKPGTVAFLLVRQPILNDDGKRGFLFQSRTSTTPQPVVLHLSFRHGRRRYAAGFRYHWRLYFAANRSCSNRGRAPPKGSFHVAVTPWSATGQPGKTQVFKGAVRYQPYRHFWRKHLRGNKGTP